MGAAAWHKKHASSSKSRAQWGSTNNNADTGGTSRRVYCQSVPPNCVQMAPPGPSHAQPQVTLHSQDGSNVPFKVWKGAHHLLRKCGVKLNGKNPNMERTSRKMPSSYWTSWILGSNDSVQSPVFPPGGAYLKKKLHTTRGGSSPQSREHLTSWRRHWHYYILVAALAAVAYINTIDSELVHDDVLAISNNKDVHTNVTDVLSVFRNDFWGRDISHEASHKSYRPLCVLTFRLNFLLGGLDPRGYHVTNVLLHAACSALYLAFCWRFVFKFRSQWAVLCAAMFAVHPIHTEAVAGVVGRADIMACILFLISLMAYIGSLGPRRDLSEESRTAYPRLIGVCLVTGSAAMFVKETGITVFGVCLLYDVTVASHGGIMSYIHNRAIGRRCRHLVTRIGTTLAIVSFLLTVRWKLMGGHLPPFTDQDNPAAFSPHLLTRLLSYWYVYACNMFLLALPWTLSYDWQMGSIPLVEALSDTRNIFTLTFIVLLVMVFYVAFTRSKGAERQRLVLGVGILVIPFLPATNLLFTVGFVLAERILYIPSMGYIILVVEGLRRLTSILPAPTRHQSALPWRRPASLVYMALLLCGMWTGRTVIRNQVWRTRHTLFRSGLQTFPHNAKMHYNYGNLMKDTGQNEAAVLHYKEAIRLWPTYASAHNNLGTMLDDLTQAERHYAEAIRINPRHAGAFFNLGNLLITLGRLEEAVGALEESVTIDDENADSHTSLASVLSRLGRHQAAETHYARAVQLSPGVADYHNNYGVFLNQRGRGEEALVTYERAIEINPRHHVAMVNAARMLRQQGRMEHAEHYLTRALSIDRDPVTLDYTGIFFFNQGQNKRALELFREALDRNPNSTEARIHYAQALNLAGDHETARRHLAAVLSCSPTNAEALHQMANVYGLQGEHQQAIHYISLAIQSCNDTEDLATLYFELGNHQKELSLYTQVLQSYKEAVYLNPDIGEAHLNLGVIYHIQGQPEKAMHHYSRAQRLLPNHKLLQENMRKLQRTFHRQGG